MNTQNPYQMPEPPSAAKPKAEQKRFTPLELFIVLLIIVVLVLLLIPVVQQASSGGPRTTCRNNLKQIALALHNYHADFGSFPPAVVYDDSGFPMHSWRVLILPYVDQQRLYNHYRMDEPWDSPNNLQLQDLMPDVYRCPEFRNNVPSGEPLSQHLKRLTNYVLITSPDAVFFGDRSPALNSVSDGVSQTIMTADVWQHAVHWMAPEDVTPSQLLTDLRMCDGDDDRNHAEGIHVGLVDGSVRWIPHDLPESDFRAMTTATAGDVVRFDF